MANVGPYIGIDGELVSDPYSFGYYVTQDGYYITSGNNSNKTYLNIVPGDTGINTIDIECASDGGSSFNTSISLSENIIDECIIEIDYLNDEIIVYDNDIEQYRTFISGQSFVEYPSFDRIIIVKCQ